MTSTDLMNVNAFENQIMDPAFAALNPQEENLADGIGSSYGIIGYRGKVWSLRLRGESHTFTRADDGSPAAFLDVIILRSASYKSKSYYPAGSFDQDNSGGRPVCAALDGITPDSDVQEQQAAACAICPRNEWKTDNNGRKGRDCSDYKRLAVLILPSQSALLFDGAPLMEPVFLRVPAASLNDLAILGEAMSKKGFHYSSYITRIGFQPDKAHPQMTFRALQKLGNDEAPIVLPMRTEPQSLRITGENEVGKQKAVASIAPPKEAGAAGTVTTGFSTQTSQTAGAAGSATRTASSTSATANTGASSQPTTNTAEDDEEAAALKALAAIKAKKAAAAKAQADAAAKAAASETVNTGFGQIIPPTEKVSTVTQDTSGLGASQPVVEVEASSGANTDADTGPAEESDNDLDARVAGLL